MLKHMLGNRVCTVFPEQNWESEESKGAKMATEEEEDELYASVRTTALDPPPIDRIAVH